MIHPCIPVVFLARVREPTVLIKCIDHDILLGNDIRFIFSTYGSIKLQTMWLIFKLIYAAHTRSGADTSPRPPPRANVVSSFSTISQLLLISVSISLFIVYVLQAYGLSVASNFSIHWSVYSLILYIHG